MPMEDYDNIIADPEFQKQFEAFDRQLEQTTRLYQKATLYLAASRMQQLANRPVRSGESQRRPLRIFRRNIRRVVERTIRLLHPRWSIMTVEEWRSSINGDRPTIMIDVTPLDPKQDGATRSDQAGIEVSGSRSEREE